MSRTLQYSGGFKLPATSRTIPSCFIAFTWATVSEYFEADFLDNSSRLVAYQPRCFEASGVSDHNIAVDMNHSIPVAGAKASVFHTDDCLMGMIEFDSVYHMGGVVNAISIGEFAAVSPVTRVINSRLERCDGETINVIDKASITTLALVEKSANPNPGNRIWMQDYAMNPPAYNYHDRDLDRVWGKYAAAFFRGESIADRGRVANSSLRANQYVR